MRRTDERCQQSDTGRAVADRPGLSGGDGLLRAEATGGLLHTGDEDGMLWAEQDKGNVRLPLAAASETESAWAAFHVRLRAFVSRRVKQRADAEDIVQKVFLDMHRSLPTLRARGNLGPWLYRTATNAVADYYRAPARRREVPAGATSDLDDLGRLPAPVDEAEGTDVDFAAGCLRPMVQLLPEDYRRAIELVELDGLTQTAAAERERISLSGMKSRIQRARRRLKAALLECCEVALDGRRGLMSCKTRRLQAAPLGCGPANRRSAAACPSVSPP
jgi:RNA polymerase sigma-70 factor (ECF subfamily)